MFVLPEICSELRIVLAAASLEGPTTSRLGFIARGLPSSFLIFARASLAAL